MTEEQIEHKFHVSWYIVAYKLLFGFAEAIIGVGVLLYGKSALNRYELYKLKELSDDPHDLLIRLTQNVVPNLLTGHVYLILYLILLGGVKIAGAIGLMYKQNWGVDLLVGLTLIMFPFQLIELLIHPSLPDFIYIFVGLFVALYLVNFQPKKWATEVGKKIPSRRLKNTI